MIAQAVVGINGVTSGQYGSLAVDTSAVDVHAPRCTPTSARLIPGPAGASCSRRRPPGTRGRSSGSSSVRSPSVSRSTRAGLDDEVAFAVAARAVRSHVSAISVGDRAPSCRIPADHRHRRAVVRRADEPGFPIAPDAGDRPPVGCDGGTCRASPPSACTAAPWPTCRRCSPPVPTSCPCRSARTWPGSPATSATSSTAGGRVRVGRRAHRRADVRVGRPAWRELIRAVATGSSSGASTLDLLRERSLVTPALWPRHAHPGRRRAGVSPAVAQVGRRVADGASSCVRWA